MRVEELLVICVGTVISWVRLLMLVECKRVSAFEEGTNRLMLMSPISTTSLHSDTALSR